MMMEYPIAFGRLKICQKTKLRNMKEKALVVFSGGQDSTTCLFWAKKHFDEVYALSFTYGQKHVHEVDIAESIAAEDIERGRAHQVYRQVPRFGIYQST